MADGANTQGKRMGSRWLAQCLVCGQGFLSVTLAHPHSNPAPEQLSPSVYRQGH